MSDVVVVVVVVIGGGGGFWVCLGVCVWGGGRAAGALRVRSPHLASVAPSCPLLPTPHTPHTHTPHAHTPPRPRAPRAQVGNGALSSSEQRAHFALWCLLKAPLLIGADLSAVSGATAQLLRSPELLAVHQDGAGVAGDLVAKEGNLEVWATALEVGGAGGERGRGGGVVAGAA